MNNNNSTITSSTLKMEGHQEKLSPGIIEEFCKLCNWAYESWITRRVIFDDNPNIDNLMKGNYGYFLERLSHITHEYALLQLIKLHDPVVMGNDINLTFEYVINYGGWNQQTVSELRELLKALNQLKDSIKPARNKVLCHNDLKSIIDNLPLGEFDKYDDVKYFDTLQKFVNTIYGSPYPFNDLAKSEAQELLNALNIPNHKKISP